MPAMALNYYDNNNTNNDALVFLEGEKANLADAFIVNNNNDLEYNLTNLINALAGLRECNG
jgi:hypothetical protein